MLTQFLDPQLSQFGRDLPPSLAAAMVLCKVGDYRDQLFEAESKGLERMIDKRRDQFVSGRHCAHLAQSLLGLDPAAIERDGRIPLWPAGSVGSITHSDVIAGALASDRYRGVGIDIELAGRVDDKLFRMLFTEAERAAITRYPPGAADIMFSAKEAGYKAIFPSAHLFIGFHEAEIELFPEQRRFTINYIGVRQENNALKSGEGFWSIAHDHVLTVFVIP